MAAGWSRELPVREFIIVHCFSTYCNTVFGQKRFLFIQLWFMNKNNERELAIIWKERWNKLNHFASSARYLVCRQEYDGVDTQSSLRLHFLLLQLFHASYCNVLLNGKGYHHYALCSSSIRIAWKQCGHNLKVKENATWHHLTLTKCYFPL